MSNELACDEYLTLLSLNQTMKKCLKLTNSHGIIIVVLTSARHLHVVSYYFDL